MIMFSTGLSTSECMHLFWLFFNRTETEKDRRERGGIERVTTSERQKTHVSIHVVIVHSYLFLHLSGAAFLESVVLSPMFLSFIIDCSSFNLHCSFSRQWWALIYMPPLNKKWIIDTPDRSVMMNIDSSTHHRLNLLDFPNELLLISIEYLPMIDALYSLVGITQRLDQLVLNPISTNTLNITCLRPELLPDRIYSLDERAFATLCRTTLPRIHHQIRHLIVDQFSIESVFHAREYPALYSLSLIDIDHVDALGLFQGKTTLVDCPRQRTSQSCPSTHAGVFSHQSVPLGDSVLHNLLDQQITSLSIDLSAKRRGDSSPEYSSTLFASILQSCQRLTKLHFCSGSGSQVYWVEFSRLNCQSALLTDLSVYTTSFGECAYLFDGHFPSLSTVTIVVQEIGRTAGCRVKAVSIILCRKNEDIREICLFFLEMFAQLETFLLVFV